MFQRDAIVRLLRDNDPATVLLLKEQLVEGGAEAVPALQELLTIDDANVTRHVREMLSAIETQQAHDEMVLLTHLFAENGDIEQAWWLLTSSLEPGLDIPPLQRKLDIWGRRLSILTAGAVSARERLHLLTGYMADELGFRGNAENYYELQNSLLSSVIETRLGIPISLAVLYMIVAKRANIHVEGFNLPGHFIVRHGDFFFDPFHRGRVLARTDCEEILARQKLKPRADYFLPASPRLIFTRMLANILFIFEEAGDRDRHDMIERWLQALDRS